MTVEPVILTYKINAQPSETYTIVLRCYVSRHSRICRQLKSRNEKDFLRPACLTYPQNEPHWTAQPCSANSCSLFSHTVIGHGLPSVTSTPTTGPASACLSRDFIGYCTGSSVAIGRTGWLSRLRGFIHHFATVV